MILNACDLIAVTVVHVIYRTSYQIQLPNCNVYFTSVTVDNITEGGKDIAASALRYENNKYKVTTYILQHALGRLVIYIYAGLSDLAPWIEYMACSQSGFITVNLKVATYVFLA